MATKKTKKYDVGLQTCLFDKLMGESLNAFEIEKLLECHGVRPGATLKLKKYIRDSGNSTRTKIYEAMVVNVFPHIVELRNEFGFTESPDKYTLLMRILGKDDVLG